MKLYKILLFVLISLILLNCAKNKNKEELETLVFNIDSSLIGEQYRNPEIGISFCPPKEWNQLSSDLMTSIEQLLQGSWKNCDWRNKKYE